VKSNSTATLPCVRGLGPMHGASRIMQYVAYRFSLLTTASGVVCFRVLAAMLTNSRVDERWSILFEFSRRGLLLHSHRAQSNFL